MKDIRVTLRTLAEVLCDQPLSVPNYQRRYSWTLMQRETLIKDIYEHYKTEEKIIDSYFCGSLILEYSNSKYLFVADGQQRLTTFIIILKSLLQFEEVEKSPVADVLASILNAAKNGFFAFSDTRQDTEFHKCLSDQTNDLKSNFDIAFKQITAIFETLPSEEYVDFAYHLLNSTTFSLTLAPPNSGLFLFERSNNRGLPLSLTDKCKSIVFNYASDIERVSRRWENFLTHCQETDRSSDVHILNYLWSVDGNRVTSSTGLDLFRSLVSSTSDELVRDLESYASYTSRIYKCYVSGSEVVCRNFRQLDCLKKQYQIRAVMSGTRNLPRTEQSQFLEELQKTAMVIALAAPSPPDVTTQLSKVLLSLKDNRPDDGVELLRQYRSLLAYSLDDYIRHSSSAKSMQNSRGLLYFWEAYLQKVATGNHLSSDVLNGTIEHILPQSKRAITAEVDLIGNLTLLDQPINSHIGNASFEERREVYKIQKYLLTQSLIIDYPVASRNEILRPLLYKADNNWTKTDIYKRGKMLSKLTSIVLDYDYVESADRNLVVQRFEIPQVNNLNYVYATLIGIAAGNSNLAEIYEFHKTRINRSITKRETDYAIQALDILELIDKQEDITLTNEGSKAAFLEYADFISDVITKHPLIVSLSQMSEDECLDYIAKHSDYEPSTRQRRYNCLKAWFKECGLVPPTQTTKQEV